LEGGQWSGRKIIRAGDAAVIQVGDAQSASVRIPWLVMVILAFGLLITYGGFSTYADQHSGTPGTAKVSDCSGGTKYQSAIRCTGSWTYRGLLVVGRVEGAGYRDIGKTIDVRIHGSDHATRPALTTSILLWTLGLLVVAFALFALWSPRRRKLKLPPAIRAHLTELIRTRWAGRDPEPVIATLPKAMEPGRVTTLVSGGPYGWLIKARLDPDNGRVRLEALEDSRMSGPEHYRVWDDGTVEPLPNERIGYALPKDCTPEQEERIKADFFEHNHRVQQHLQERGFI
jgi:hypothetical protein